jgi:hypothetical protein
LGLIIGGLAIFFIGIKLVEMQQSMANELEGITPPSIYQFMTITGVPITLIGIPITIYGYVNRFKIMLIPAIFCNFDFDLDCVYFF